MKRTLSDDQISALADGAAEAPGAPLPLLEPGDAAVLRAELRLRALLNSEEPDFELPAGFAERVAARAVAPAPSSAPGEWLVLALTAAAVALWLGAPGGAGSMLGHGIARAPAALLSTEGAPLAAAALAIAVWWRVADLLAATATARAKRTASAA
jgi:hypothetical protein